MTAERTGLEAELVWTILEQLPRESDSDPTTVLIALHRAIAAINNNPAHNDDQVASFEGFDAVIEDMLTKYRPRSLHGVSAMLRFIINDLELDEPDYPHSMARIAWLKGIEESVRHLATLDARRSSDASLMLPSPVVGQDADSTSWRPEDPSEKG